MRRPRRRIGPEGPTRRVSGLHPVRPGANRPPDLADLDEEEPHSSRHRLDLAIEGRRGPQHAQRSIRRYREAPTGGAGPGRVDGGVQGEQVGLARDLADHPDDWPMWFEFSLSVRTLAIACRASSTASPVTARAIHLLCDLVLCDLGIGGVQYLHRLRDSPDVGRGATGSGGSGGGGLRGLDRLAKDLMRRVAHRPGRVAGGVEGSLDRGIEGRDRIGERGHVRPGQDRRKGGAARHHRRDRQVEGLGAEADLGAPGQARGIGDVAALVMRALVEHVHRSPDHAVGVDSARQVFAQAVHRLDVATVGTGDVRGGRIEDKDVDRKRVDHRVEIGFGRGVAILNGTTTQRAK